ncbi:site-specific DNA-methyltransferase [uncultured Flavobacterium sp.]|uniref:DNA methyltransferase n=1 Tax=uncultured Flavobacterium sp. TaxID=165435 RepID=UPI002594AC71|nr:site-specific DNA-methyltransferase [uncultured Flavobacterium sp.]
MQNLQNELIDLLKNEDNLVIDGHLNKNKIVELALKVEPQLISLLIKNETFKKHFFQEVENVLVFDKIKFQRFVNNKSFLPDSYTAFKNKIGLITNDDDLDNFISTSNEVVLAWPHKDCVLEGGQTKEDQKRNEIFWNETLAPDSVDRLLDAKVLTNFKKFDKDGEHKVTELKGNENLIIKGNNLLALSSLLKTHRGKIKLIYIDPPYNTGNDGFKYNDAFNHSTWLTFMKNRLEVSKKILSQDGLIFVHCDDNEQAYLKILMDEVFGRDNFVNTIVMKTINPNGIKTTHATKTILKVKELILVYKKDLINIKPQYKSIDKYDKYYDLYIDGDLNNLKNCSVLKLKDKIKELGFKFDLKDEKFKNFIITNSDRIFQTKFDKRVQSDTRYEDGGLYIYDDNPNYYVYQKRFGLKLSKTIKKVFGVDEISILLGDVWDDFKLNNLYLEGDVDFSNAKKPEHLIYRIIDMCTNEGDTVLDFHLGSGTTSAVAHKMNRRYIGIEQMDYIENVAVERMKKVIFGEQNGVSEILNWQGGGSFVYAELMQYNQKYIDLIQNAETKDQIITIWNDMQDTAFLSYQFDKKTFNERLDAFKAAPIEDMKQYLIEVLDKNQLYVNYSEINDETFNVSQEDKELNKQFYSKK